ncbi:MAG: acetyl-CoA carboxylase biotin carboxyl carrier protein [Acholeplasma sp.]
MKLTDIKSIIKDFETSTLTVLELEAENVKLKLSKNKENQIEAKIESPELKESTQPQSAVQSQAAQTTQVGINDQSIKSPLVGTFYEASSPEAEAFVKVGDTVKKGQVVCIVEAMKIMNEITSSVDGKIAKVNFKNGDVVGFDDVLFTVVQS